MENLLDIKWLLIIKPIGVLWFLHANDIMW